MKRELSPTAVLNALTGFRNKRRRLQDEARRGFHTLVGGNKKWEGRYQFRLIDAATGEVETTRTLNTTVDEGENALLEFVGNKNITDNQVQTFSGDGSTTQFDIPAPYHPIRNVNSVTVGGSSQTVATDYAVDYFAGTLFFESAPATGTDNISIDVDYYTAPWEWLAVGTDGTSVSESDTSLGTEDTRIGLDSGYYTRDTSAVEITGQWTFGTGEANVSIAEAALFNVPSSASVNGDMFNRTVVSPTIDKSSSQELQATWTLSMS